MNLGSTSFTCFDCQGSRGLFSLHMFALLAAQRAASGAVEGRLVPWLCCAEQGRRKGSGCRTLGSLTRSFVGAVHAQQERGGGVLEEGIPPLPLWGKGHAQGVPPAAMGVPRAGTKLEVATKPLPSRGGKMATNPLPSLGSSEREHNQKWVHNPVSE